MEIDNLGTNQANFTFYTYAIKTTDWAGNYSSRYNNTAYLSTQTQIDGVPLNNVVYSSSFVNVFNRKTLENLLKAMTLTPTP